MKYDISIIIPAFNVEKTLARAINSSLEQSNINPEIIIVNDGSTDKSGVIADSYSHHYKNIKTIHQLNKGLGGARNTGILNSTSKYITFLDSDDYIDASIIYKSLTIMNEENSDLLRFGYKIIDFDGKITIPKRQYPRWGGIEGLKFILRTCFHKRFNKI